MREWAVILGRGFLFAGAFVGLSAVSVFVYAASVESGGLTWQGFWRALPVRLNEVLIAARIFAGPSVVGFAFYWTGKMRQHIIETRRREEWLEEWGADQLKRLRVQNTNVRAENQELRAELARRRRAEMFLRKSLEMHDENEESAGESRTG